ncbi:hypothetical protein GCM10022224_098620 [Nonomuraea antimicrobica]|uniref:Uncharacterized protein n=1 Tax=Nonomuraea antimicrobica TaxID=561173 RepID=A0ABP7ED80_9ACTN
MLEELARREAMLRRRIEEVREQIAVAMGLPDEAAKAGGAAVQAQAAGGTRLGAPLRREASRPAR